MKEVIRNIIVVGICIFSILIVSCNNNEISDTENEDLSVVSSKLEMQELNNSSHITMLESIGEAILKGKGESTQEVLNEAYADYGDVVENIYYADAYGRTVLTPHIQLPEDYDARDRPWYKNALENKVYQADPYEDVSVQKTIQSISKAIYRDGQLIGIVAMDYELETSDTSVETSVDVIPSNDPKNKMKLSAERKEE